ncbi:hypothetical protein GC163_12890 [bacterium]|nr:hypothetical protein [bacterium]
MSRRHKLYLAGIWLAALPIAFHPVSTDSLWWELGKGRAVVSGHLHPTADLIAGMAGADADWLSGLLPYLLMSLFGMSGVMGLKVAVVLGLTWLFVRRSAETVCQSDRPMIGIAVLAMLVVMHSAGEPGLLSDVVCLAALYCATEKLTTNPDHPRLGLVFTILAVWANLGPRVIMGLFVAGPALWARPAKLAQRLGMAVAMLGCLCLTPAGWMTLRNSLIQTWPSVNEQLIDVQAAGWHPWWNYLFAAESISFLVLSAAYLSVTWLRASWQQLFVFGVAQVLACCSAENLPLAALWMMLAMTAASGKMPSLSTHSRMPSSPSVPRRTEYLTANFEKPLRLTWKGAAYGIVFLWVSWVATHPWPGCESSVGWGLDPRLNPDAFAASLAETNLAGNAHCVGVREAGLLIWHKRTGIRPFDTPVSALLNHRLHEHVLLTSDLTRRWQTPHRRINGEWGGWWAITQARNIKLLVIPSESLDLITALEPTIWKPLSLNATSLAYGVAGDPGVTPQIVKTLSLRHIVDRGTWTYQPEGESASGLMEFFAWRDNSTATLQSLRLARVFRSMELNVAALKVLNSMPGRNCPAAREEFFANQMALGYRERIIAGHSSEFRLRTSLGNDQLDGVDVLTRLNWPLQAELSDKTLMSEITALYVSGERTRALSKPSGKQPEEIYAKALLLLEAGESRQTAQAFQGLIGHATERRLSILSRGWVESLGE